MTIVDQKKQREYLEKIIAQATQQAKDNSASLLFDPQGRVLIDVALSEKDQELFKEGFGANRKPATSKITVSLDITEINELNLAYEKFYGLDRLDEKQKKQLSEVRGSIIPLQQEFHFHLALAARTYEKIAPKKFTKDQMDIAHHEAMLRIQKSIQQEFAHALQKASGDNSLEDIKLIQELDKARKKISEEAQTIFMEEVVKATGQRLSKDELKKLKHTAELTTASPNDLLHIDQSLGQAIWISGSENAAHERIEQKLGVHAIADRQILTLPLNDKGQKSEPRLQIRTPSLDVKKHISMENAINDVSVKLSTIAAKYSMHDSIEENPLGRKAFTYNLHTAINHTLDDWFKNNKQSWGATVILSGAHLYNKSQLSLQKDGNKRAFCFVQNLSVNGFGDSLGYGWNIGWNKLRNEATLMAEMAMLQNLVGPNDSHPEIDHVFKLYEQFLSHCNAQGENYFSRSKEGQEAIKQIKAIKAGWTQQDARIHEENATPVMKAKEALKTIMANNLHHQHEYAKLVQSLSIFIEGASIAGCKSGNERAQAVNGRVSILDHEANKPESAIFQAVEALAHATPKDVKSHAASLKRSLDNKYDKHLQSALSLVSDVDQGASAKVNAKTPWYKFWTKLNPNYAEESSLNHLSQAKSGNMQAHKGLTEQMASAWEGHPKSFSDYLGKVGIILSVITFPIGPLVAAGIYQYSYKPYKEELKKQTEAKIEKCEEVYLQKSIPIHPIEESFINHGASVNYKPNHKDGHTNEREQTVEHSKEYTKGTCYEKKPLSLSDTHTDNDEDSDYQSPMQMNGR